MISKSMQPKYENYRFNKKRSYRFKCKSFYKKRNNRKSRNEKLALITQYVNAGYFVTEEVKGATPGNQHWVAVTGVNHLNLTILRLSKYANCNFKIKYRNTNSIY